MEITIISDSDFKNFNFSDDFLLEAAKKEDLNTYKVSKHQDNNIFYFETYKTKKLINFFLKNEEVVNLELNKIVKPVKIEKFTFNVYDCSEKIDTPIPDEGEILEPSEDDIILEPKTYLFSGINPDNNQIEIWYDTNKNSKGPSGKIYIQVGIVELDSSI